MENRFEITRPTVPCWPECQNLLRGHRDVISPETLNESVTSVEDAAVCRPMFRFFEMFSFCLLVGFFEKKKSLGENVSLDMSYRLLMFSRTTWA